MSVNKSSALSLFLNSSYPSLVSVYTLCESEAYEKRGMGL